MDSDICKVIFCVCLCERFVNLLYEIRQSFNVREDIER